jgi:hypothetical protein
VDILNVAFGYDSSEKDIVMGERTLHPTDSKVDLAASIRKRTLPSTSVFNFEGKPTKEVAWAPQTRSHH